MAVDPGGGGGGGGILEFLKDTLKKDLMVVILDFGTLSRTNLQILAPER